MSFLKNLFGNQEPRNMSYVDAFIELSRRLTRRLAISEWETGVPQSYNLAEQTGIDQAQSRMKYAAGCPEVEEPLQRLIVEIGLINAARELKYETYEGLEEEHSDDDLEPIVSTYLKAWLCNCSPFVLLELAGLLADQGLAVEAKNAVGVALDFPAYARGRKMNEMESVAQTLAWELFPSGMHSNAHSRSQGIYSPEALTLLKDEATDLQEKLSKLAQERR